MSLTKLERTFWMMAIPAALSFVCVLGYIIFLKPTKAERLVLDAHQLVKKAGGPDKVLAEADAVFNKFPAKTNFIFVQERELRPYPALASLECGEGIRIDPPGYISVQVGGHSGYFFKIIETNTVYHVSSDEYEIVKGRIFVRR